MLKIMTTTAVLLSLVSIARAEPTYQDVIKTCGLEWSERTDKDTNKGRDAWNKFRAECVKRKGYVTKQERRASIVRVPDKQ